jgi:crossover junction endodeoxyribonuclease RuvC
VLPLEYEPVFDPRGPVLGIDPGVSRCGYGAVIREGSVVGAVSYGVIRTSPDDPLPERLAQLAAELADLVSELRPCAMAVERVLFQNNARTAISVGQASGLALVAAARVGIPVEQYSPNEVKLAVAGHGGADKEQVQLMVTRLLRLGEVPSPPDAADALALALCHEWSAPMRARVGASTGGNDPSTRVSGLDRAVAAAIARDAR